MGFTKTQVDRLMRRAQKALGLDEWTIEWQWGVCDYEGDIEMRFTEKHALVTLDRKRIPDRQVLARTIYHELCHCLFEPVERGVSDFAEHYIKDGKARDVFYEQLNTRENEVIDSIVVNILRI